MFIQPSRCPTRTPRPRDAMTYTQFAIPAAYSVQDRHKLPDSSPLPKKT